MFKRFSIVFAVAIFLIVSGVGSLCYVKEAAGGELDPQAMAFLQMLKDQNIPPIHTLTPVQARAVFDPPVLVLDPPAVADVKNLNIPGPAGEIPVRIYTPEGKGPFPILVYFHGGGWVIGTLDSHDSLCRTFANSVPCIVVSVDYRLAPEHIFPAAVEDAYAATKWVADNARSFNGDPARIAVGGDSAGGNLSAVVSLMARDQNGPSLVFQLLLYPAVDLRLNTDSMREYGEGYFLTKADMEWFRGYYLPNQEDWTNPRVSPLLAEDLSRLPSALVITAEFDPLRDEGEAYASRLAQAGVSVKKTRYDGMIHAFINLGKMIDRAKVAIDEASGLSQKFE